MLKHPTTFTIEGVRRAMEFREIHNDGYYTTMLLITLLLYTVAGIALSIPLYQRCRIAALLVAIAVVLSFIPIITGYLRMAPLTTPETIPDFRILFNVLDGIVIMFAYCYGLSYEAANLILFAVVEPAIIVFLFIFAISKKRTSS